MPEGDTIHAIARALGPELVGRALTLLEVMQRPVAWGPEAVVSSCEAVGKHLVVTLATPVGPRALRVHLGMKGEWYRWRPGERWTKSPSGRRVVIATADWVFVCFEAMEVELATRAEVRHLGPDLLGAELDMAAVIGRARAAPGDLALGELLMRQTIASGIGNVYKSEALFLERLDPWRPASTVDDAKLAALYQRARDLMRVNLERGGMRATTTRGPGTPRRDARYWVYRRANRPCRVCGAPIASRAQGDQARMTYWCPRCQT